jgi:hypothetical protein
MHQPQKVLVVELIFCPTRCAGAQRGHRVDGDTGPQVAGDLLPFRAEILQPMPGSFKHSVFRARSGV